MPISLKTILKKQDKSSRDIGLILMYYAKATLEDKEGDFPLTQAEISELAKKLIFRADKYKYDVLEAFYDAITTERLKAYDNARRIAGGTNLLRLYIRSFDEYSKQDTLRYSLPLTLTNYGYKFYAAATRAAAEKKTYTFYEIFSHYLYGYLRLYNKEPIIISSSIYNGYAQAESLPITSKTIKEQYQATHRDIYITDADHPAGVNIDTPEGMDLFTANLKSITQYERAQLSESIRQADRAYYFDDIEAMEAELPNVTKYLVTDDLEIPSKKADLKEWYAKLIRNYNTNKLNPHKFKFKYVGQEMPAGTTLYYLLMEALERYDEPGRESDPTGLIFPNDARSPAKQLRELKAATPDLFKALCDQIQHDIPQFESLDAAELMKATIKGADLKELDNDIMQDKFKNVSFADMKEFIINSKLTSYLEKRQARNGIALFSFMHNKGTIRIQRPAESGKTYTPPMPEPHTSIKEIAEQDIAAIYESEIYKPLKWILAYNEFINICAAGLKVDFMKCATLKEIPLIMMNLRTLNGELYAAYRNIQGDDKTKAERERIFKEKFKPVDPDTIKIPQDMQTAITETLEAVLENKIGAQWISKAPQIIQEIADSKT